VYRKSSLEGEGAPWHDKREVELGLARTSNSMGSLKHSAGIMMWEIELGFARTSNSVGSLKHSAGMLIRGRLSWASPGPPIRWGV